MYSQLLKSCRPWALRTFSPTHSLYERMRPCYVLDLHKFSINLRSSTHTDSLLLTLLSWLSCCQHIDQIMSSHGKQIMQAVTLILEAEHSIEVKEQVSTPSASRLQMILTRLRGKPALQSSFNILQIWLCAVRLGSRFVQLGMFSGGVVFAELEAHQRESVGNFGFVLNHKEQNVQISALM